MIHGKNEYAGHVNIRESIYVTKNTTNIGVNDIPSSIAAGISDKPPLIGPAEAATAASICTTITNNASNMNRNATIIMTLTANNMIRTQDTLLVIYTKKNKMPHFVIVCVDLLSLLR
jgi:hypothetical protein